MAYDPESRPDIAFDAIVFEPIIMKLTKNPRVHAVLGPGVILYVRLPADERIPETVPAVAFQDCYSYYGVIPTANIGIGLRNAKLRFETTSTEAAES